MTQMMEWRQRYESVGVKAIPLSAGKKKKPLRGYYRLSASEQWERWRGAANIGIIPAGKLAVIDTENQIAYTDAKDGLSGMGIDVNRLPTVRTASGVGRHIYVKIRGAPDGEHSRKLDVGKPGVKNGELMFGNRCYCVAPVSVVHGNQYRFVQGLPEWLPSLPVVEWQDLGWLTDVKRPVHTLDISKPPLPLVKRSLPQRAEFLMDNLPFMPKGKNILNYATRSEAEQAVITMAILAGWDYEDILAEFEKCRPGHFAEHDRPSWYLRLSYKNALRHILDNSLTHEIIEAYINVALSPWSGRADLQRVTLLALLCKCWQFNRWIVRAGQRDLALLTNASQRGVGKALKKLGEDGFIEKTKSWAWWREIGYPTQYRIRTVKLSSHDSPLGESLRWCLGRCRESRWQEFLPKIGLHPLWCREGLGRSTGHIYDLIAAGVATQAELIECSGKSRPTVRNALGLLSSHKMIEQSDDGWITGEVTRDEVAEARGCFRLVEDKQQAFEEDRERFRTEKPSGRQRC